MIGRNQISYSLKASALWGDNQSRFGSLLRRGDINFPCFMGREQNFAALRMEERALSWHLGEGNFGSPCILGINIGLLKEDSVFNESKNSKREVW